MLCDNDDFNISLALGVHECQLVLVPKSLQYALQSSHPFSLVMPFTSFLPRYVALFRGPVPY